MKKALAILMVLAAVTGVVVADVADIAVSGFGKLTWGLDLDGVQANGFKNSTEWDIKIPLLAKKTFTTKSEGDAYAEISIVDAQYNINADEGKDTFTGGDKEIDSVKAKLVFGNVYMTIHGAPDFTPENATIWAPIKNDDYFADDAEGKLLEFSPGFKGNGTKIGYKAEKYEVAVKLASLSGYSRAEAGDPTSTVAVVLATADDADLTQAEATAAGWLDADGTALGAALIEGAPYLKITTVAGTAADTLKSKYAIGFDASVTPSDMISAAATFNYAAWAGSVPASSTDAEVADSIMSAGFVVTVKPVADVVVKAALDAGSEGTDLDGDRAWAYDASASASYKFVEAGMYYASVSTKFANGSVLDLGSYDADMKPTANLAAYLKVTDGGFVPNLSAWATVMANNLLAAPDKYEAAYVDGGYALKDVTAPIAFGTGASYKYMMGDVKYVKPFFELFGQNMSYDGVESGTDFVTAGNIGVEYGLFTNTIVTAKYEAGSTNDDSALHLIKTTAKSEKGLFTLACKVTY